MYDQDWRKCFFSQLLQGVILKHFYNVQSIYKDMYCNNYRCVYFAKIVVYLKKENIFINCFYFISTNKINMKESCILAFYDYSKCAF